MLARPPPGLRSSLNGEPYSFLAQLSPIPIRSTVVGCVPNSACRRRGGSGSDTFDSDSRRSSAMNAAGSRSRSSANASARASTWR